MIPTTASPIRIVAIALFALLPLAATAQAPAPPSSTSAAAPEAKPALRSQQVRPGLHVLLELPDIAAHDARRLRDACRRRGVGVYPAAHFYARPPAHAELLLGYAALGEDTIREGITRLARALDEL